MTRNDRIAAAALFAGGLGLAAAGAAPLNPAATGLPQGAPIERAAAGCAPGFYPNPWGLCRPNLYGPRPYWGRPVYGRYGVTRLRPGDRRYRYVDPWPYY